MRKTAFFILLVAIFNLLIFSFSSCQNNAFRTNDSIEKIMLCTLPKSSQILHETFSTYLLGTRTADMGAKISMTKEDYNTFISSLNNEYQRCKISDCSHSIVNGLETIYVPNSVENCIGFESTLYSWWDLNAQEIDCIFYMDTKNPLGAKHVSTRRIYVMVLEESVLIYLSFIE